MTLSRLLNLVADFKSEWNMIMINHIHRGICRIIFLSMECAYSIYHHTSTWLLSYSNLSILYQFLLSHYMYTTMHVTCDQMLDPPSFVWSLICWHRIGLCGCLRCFLRVLMKYLMYNRLSYKNLSTLSVCTIPCTTQPHVINFVFIISARWLDARSSQSLCVKSYLLIL